MFTMMNTLVLSAIFSVKNAFNNVRHELATDERGLSGVVVAVLLIVIAVLAILVLWAAMSGLLEEWWKKIVGRGTEITTDFEGN